MGKIGLPEIILIILALLLLFGGKKIPELMKGFGQGIREFKKASRGESDDHATDDFKKSINQDTDKK
jgi:sec-independent protein translocase protein TatA